MIADIITIVVQYIDKQTYYNFCLTCRVYYMKAWKHNKLNKMDLTFDIDEQIDLTKLLITRYPNHVIAVYKKDYSIYRNLIEVGDCQTFFQVSKDEKCIVEKIAKKFNEYKTFYIKRVTLYKIPDCLIYRSENFYKCFCEIINFSDEFTKIFEKELDKYEIKVELPEFNK